MTGSKGSRMPRVIAWETTRRCALACRDCRGAARDRDYAGELSTDECMLVISSIADFMDATCQSVDMAEYNAAHAPLLMLTGGEPMARPDIFALADYASSRSLRVVMAPCGHLLNAGTARQIKDAGIQAINISLDGADAATHNAFRGVPNAFESALSGLAAAREAGIPFQISTTVTTHNIGQLPAILDLAVAEGAKTMDFFFLVPTGRGRELARQAISSEAYEEALTWIVQAAKTAPLRLRTTCAPHSARMRRQRSGNGRPAHPSGGCMAGDGFVFISHRGILQPCGFLDISCGDLRAANFNFRKLYETSEVFAALRDPNELTGRCGACEYRRICGGCRARAYAASGDYLAEEPSCAYIPAALARAKS